MKVTTSIKGMDDVEKTLSEMAPRQALNLMRSTVHGVAGGIAKDAKTFMSKDTGTMIKSTKIARRRVTLGRARSDVVVTRAAFYWRFREYGQGPDGIEDAMFMKATAIFRANMDQIFVTMFGKKFEAALARKARAAAKAAL